jgi:hypothetical protein
MNSMKLLSVNVSLPTEVLHRGKTVTTGIFKEPVNGRVVLVIVKFFYVPFSKRGRGAVSPAHAFYEPPSI